MSSPPKWSKNPTKDTIQELLKIGGPPEAPPPPLYAPRRYCVSGMKHSVFFGGYGLLYESQEPEEKYKILHNLREYKASHSEIVRPFGSSADTEGAFVIWPRCRASEKTPDVRRIWFLFPGSGMLTLQWLEVLAYGVREIPTDLPTAAAATASDGSSRANQDRFQYDMFVLMDYPGQGLCVGSESDPTPQSIHTLVLSISQTIAYILNIQLDHLFEISSTMGYSLGCAAALQFASLCRIGGRCVLVSPFSSASDVAKFTVAKSIYGSSLIVSMVPYSIIPDFDNKKRMMEFLKSTRCEPEDRKVVIFHGTLDDICPFSGSLELVKLHRGATLVRCEGASHSVFWTHSDLIMSELCCSRV